MKKSVFSLMTLVAALAALASCNKKEEEAPIVDGAYQYRFEIVENDTRATLEGKDGVFWEVDKDKVGIFAGSETAQEVGLTVIDDKKYVVLSSNNPLTNVTVNAFYPYAENTAGASNASIFINPEQLGGSVSAMPMAGIPLTITDEQTNGRINFLNLGGVIDFRVYSSTYAGETIESITFTASDQKIAGTATMNLAQVNNTDEDKLDLTFGNDGVSSVTLTQEGVVAASKDAVTTPAYMVVAPFSNLSGTITIVTNAASYTFNFTDKSLGRSKVTKYNMNLDNAVREAFVKTYTSVGTNQLSEGTYLLVAYESGTSGDGAGTYICDIPNTRQNDNSHTVIKHIKYATSNESIIVSNQSLEKSNSEIIACEVYISKSGDNWLVKVKKTGKYLYCPSSSYSIGFTDDASLAGHAWSLTGSNIFFDNGDYHFYHSGSDKGFSYRTSSDSNGPYSYNVRYYKLSGSSTSQTLYFERLSEGQTIDYEFTSSEPFVEPELKGNKTTVTYSSSDTKVAAIDATTGEVTFTGKPGLVTITASAVAQGDYTASEATYKINVSNDNYEAPTITYYKASVLDVNYEYLIVSGNNAMQNNSGTLGVYDVVVNNNETISIEDGEEELLLWKASAGYNLKNGNHSLYRDSSTLSGNTTNSRDWNFDGSHLTTVGNNGTYYAYYENGWKAATDAHDIALFTAHQPRQGEALAFNETNLVGDVYASANSFVQPTLNTVDGETAVYSSSNTAVATVNSSTGAVTFVAEGSVTITAVVAGINGYQGARASYSITVSNSTPVPTYYKVDELENGKQYIIVSNGHVLVLSGTTVSSASVSTTDTAGEVKYDAPTSALWTANVSGTSVKVKNGNNYLRHSGSNAAFSIGTTDSRNAIVYDAENNTVKVGNYYLNFNGTSFVLSSSLNGTSAAFFSATKPLPSLSFDKASVIYDLANNDWTSAMPVLSPANADVTYTFVNNNNASIISSIDANGAVTLVASPAKGTATVTAAAKTPSDYKVASASYTVQVINSNEIPTYTKVSEITSGATYLIIAADYNNYNGKGQMSAFAGDEAGTSVDVDGTSGTITGNYSAYEFVITASGSNYTLKNGSNYVTGDETKSSRYIKVSTTEGTMSLTDAATLKAASSDDGLVDDAFYFYYTKQNSKEVLYLNSDGKYKIGGTGRKYGVYLYKLTTE